MKKLISTIVLVSLIAVPAIANLTDGLDAYWSINSATDSSVAKIILENASFAPRNIFGMFDKTDISNKLVVFVGADGVNDLAVVSILGEVSGGISLRSVNMDTLTVRDTAIFAGNAFGYYLKTPQGTFYSDTLLNSDQFDHMLTDILLEGSEYQLRWEDLYGGGDRDFDDFVVNVQSVNPIIPAPGAIMLGGIGVSIVGWLRRRRTF